MTLDIIPISENTLLIEFKQEISTQVHQQVLALTTLLEQELNSNISDIIPAYASIHLHLFSNVSLSSTANKIREIARTNVLSGKNSPSQTNHKTVSIPVYYGEEVAPDLAAISEAANLSVDDAIQLHSQTEYSVYALGFLPGFPYLGLIAPKLASPRKSQPRKRVPAGSVGIADQQTGIYPIDSPGGWQIIGRTPIRLIKDDESQPALLEVGDKVQFRAINREEFITLGGSLEWH